MSQIDPQRKKVALLAVAICTMNMPFMLLMRHMQGSTLETPLVIFYVLAMAALVVYTFVQLAKFKRGGR